MLAGLLFNGVSMSCFSPRSRFDVMNLLLAFSGALIASGVPHYAEQLVGDPVKGETLTASCVACHSEDGNAVIPDYPNLAGQNERYLAEQMRLIKSNDRPIAVMVGQLDSMSDQDMQDVTAYYASLPGKIGQAEAENLELGEFIYRGGIMKKGVAACISCHAPDGQGNRLAGFPRVSGQPFGYTVLQLKAYREGQRTTDEMYNGMMRDIAANLTDMEIEAVANYIVGLYQNVED